MQVRLYRRAADYASLVAMHVSQGSPLASILRPMDVPRLGYVVEAKDGKLIAMGFIRQIEGQYGMFDTFATDAHESSTVRHIALTMVTSALITKARVAGLKAIIATSRDTGIISRAKSLGFQTFNETCLTLPLITMENVP